MRTYLLPALLMTGLVSVSFTPPSAPANLQIGTYGVCGCDPSSPSSPVIQLEINADNSFHYVDRTDPEQTMDVTGRWELKGSSISLWENGTTDAPFEKWNMDKEMPCLRSRQGLTFTRLCHLEACK